MMRAVNDRGKVIARAGPPETTFFIGVPSEWWRDG
jgi:hypothetical protein